MLKELLVQKNGNPGTQPSCAEIHSFRERLGPVTQPQGLLRVRAVPSPGTTIRLKLGNYYPLRAKYYVIIVTFTVS